MCKSIPEYHSSHRTSSNSLSTKETIGDLFRDYGEQYIQSYKPNLQQIKLIRAIRICKTPALGGKVILCKSCGHKHYIYHSCGHSQCMLCQSIKREQWMDKLRANLLSVPYLHVVFTLPHQLNGLARINQRIIYNGIIKAAWNSVHTISKKQGFTPGMTAVLHTFGSDMKYHIHVHALVTYGGINKNNEWQNPDKKHGLASYRNMCAAFKKEMINLIKSSKQLQYHTPIDNIIMDIKDLRWVLHSTRPTMHTQIIESYLARYINRVAVSKNRLQYIKENEMVNLLYNDYKNQLNGKPAPKAISQLHPLVAIHQVLQHVLPAHFQKSRSYGLHHTSSKIKQNLDAKFNRNNNSIRTLFQIITTLINQTPYSCEKYKSTEYIIEEITRQPRYINKFLSIDSLKSPPNATQNITINSNLSQVRLNLHVHNPHIEVIF